MYVGTGLGIGDFICDLFCVYARTAWGLEFIFKLMLCICACWAGDRIYVLKIVFV